MNSRNRPSRTSNPGPFPAGKRSLSLHMIHQRFGFAGVVVVVALILLAILTQRSGKVDTAGDWGTYHQKSFKVVHVSDGDTIRIDHPDGDSKTTIIRFWGIDTPEINHGPDEPPDQPFSREAKARVTELAQGRRVTLKLQEHSLRDKYGRLLAYIILPDGRSLNELLVEEGLARADQRHPHDLFNEYLAIEAQAKRKKLGIWSQGKR